MSEPLHVQVALALGWTLEATAHEHACGTPPPWIDLESLNVCANIGSRKFHAVPSYDTSWEATGPLIERWDILTAQTGDGWVAANGKARIEDEAPRRVDLPVEGDGQAMTFGETPQLAVCHLILHLHAAGKLKAA